MKMPLFAYHRPASLDEALQLLSEHGGEAKILAGGQSLLPIMSLRLGQPGHLIDISRIPGIDHIVDDADGGLAIGATVRHADAEDSEAVRRLAPMVAEALPHVGHRAIRNRGTVVGSLAHADPAAEMPAVALALGARFTAASARRQRTIEAADFFQGFLTTALEEDELLLGVGFGPLQANTGVSVKEISRRHGDFAIVGLATEVELDGDGSIARAALSFFGAATTPVRVQRAEAFLVGQTPSPDVFEEAGRIVRDDLDPPYDAHGTTAYRKHIAAVLTRQALAEAVDKIGVPA